MDGTSIGLSKKQSYTVGTLLMLSFFILAIPFGDDFFINIPIAVFIHTYTGLDIMISLLLTYTIMPITLLIFGAWIYPGKTINTIKSKIHKTSKIGHRLIYNPFIWLAALAISWLLWDFYSNGGSSILQSILSQAGL